MHGLLARKVQELGGLADPWSGNCSQDPVLVVHQDELLDAIECGSKKLSASQVDRCAKVLDMLRQSAAHLFEKPDTPSRRPQTSLASD